MTACDILRSEKKMIWFDLKIHCPKKLYYYLDFLLMKKPFIIEKPTNMLFILMTLFRLKIAEFMSQKHLINKVIPYLNIKHFSGKVAW